MTVHELSRQEARRIAVRAQLLSEPRPTDLFQVIDHLTVLQIDPTSAIAPSADLVLWSRLGSSYSTADLREGLEERELVEIRGMVRTADYVSLLRDDMLRWPGPDPREWQLSVRDWVEDNDLCRRDILDRLENEGPLLSRELPDTCERPWRSTGWTNNKNVTQLLEFMTSRGEVAIAGRKGRQRLWDVASRVYPDVPPVLSAEAAVRRNELRLRALGIARERAMETPVEPLDVGDRGEEAVVEGVRGTWRIDPTYLEGGFTGRAALLSPFDRLVQDRKRLSELFDYDYLLEMFKPVAKRRWGYYALPILYEDRLVGKLDATADTKAGALFVDAVHEDVRFTRKMTAAVDREIADLARWLDLELTLPD